MIRYNIFEFRDWLMKQHKGHAVVHAHLSLCELHTIFLNFTDEYENEAIREEMRIEKEYKERRAEEYAAAQAARERTARKNASDAVAAEIDGMRHG